jgi:hypothetical protein
MIITQAASRLDNPVWAALTTGNASLAEGGPLARRFHPNVGPFAGVVDMTAPALEALAMLVPPEGRLVLESVDRIDAPAGLAIDMQAPILQMILNAPARGGAGPDHVLLGKADVPDMMDLAGRVRSAHGPSNSAGTSASAQMERWRLWPASGCGSTASWRSAPSASILRIEAKDAGPYS